MNSLINLVSNSKQFSFSRSDINCIINCFGQNVSTRTDIQNRSSNIVFNTSIRNNNDCFRIHIRVFNDFVKISKINFYDIFISVIYCMKQKNNQKNCLLNNNQKRFLYAGCQKKKISYSDDYWNQQHDFWVSNIVWKSDFPAIVDENLYSLKDCCSTH